MKKHLFSLAVISLALTACSSEEIVDVSPTQGKAIGFENVVNKNTRAVNGDLTSKNFDTFMVYGYYTKDGMATPIQIFNGVTVLKKDNKWTYDGVRYWVPNCTYYFYAYSCGDIELASGKGNPVLTLTNAGSVDERALSILSYVCDGTHQHDLVCAESEAILAKEKGNEDVSLKFSHSLCKIKAIFTTDFPDGYEVKVTNVRVTQFDNKADFNVGTGVWSNHSSEDSPFVNLAIEEGKNTMTNVAGSSIETSEIFLIPKIYDYAKEYVKLHFTVQISKDGSVILERNINGSWSPNWEKSRIYKYNINITGSSAGIEPIVFAASQELGSNSWDTSKELDMVFAVDAAASSTGK